jgi:competence protein ComEC
VFAVGNGSAAALTTPNRHALVFDAGTLSNWDVGKTVVRGLKSLGVRALDFVCVSHANFDHYSGVPSLLESYSVDSLIVSSYFPRERRRHASVKLWYELLGSNAAQIETTIAGRDVELPPAFSDEGVSVEVLWPPDGLDGWRPNDRSLVLRLTVAGHTILLPGDIERAAMNALLESAEDGRLSLSSDVLIAPHHGSIVGRTTAAFYAAVKPHTVIVSSGRDRSKLVAMVRETLGSSCRVFNTREVGAVVVRVEPDGQLVIDAPFASPSTAP